MVSAGFACPYTRLWLSALAVSGALFTVSVPSTKLIV